MSVPRESWDVTSTHPSSALMVTVLIRPTHTQPRVNQSQKMNTLVFNTSPTLHHLTCDIFHPHPSRSFARWTPTRPPPGKGTLSAMLQTTTHLAPDTRASHGHVFHDIIYCCINQNDIRSSRRCLVEDRHLRLKCPSLVLAPVRLC